MLAAMARLATYADIEALPENMVGEIIFGSLHTHPRPARSHGRAAFELGMELGNPFGRGRGGPGGWVFIGEQELHLGPHVVVPDISGWRTSRYPSHETTPFSTVAPDWLAEFLSPSTQKIDRTSKLEIYAGYGVSHCWYVDATARTLEVLTLVGGKYSIAATFKDDDAVAAVPFEAHTFQLNDLWSDAAK